MEKWNLLTDQFVETFAGNWDLKTENWYRDRLRWWLRFVEPRRLKPKKVTGAHLNGFNGYLRKEARLAHSTRENTIGALKTFLTWLHRKRIIKHNPFFDLDYQKPRKERDEIEPITITHARLMIRAAERSGTLAGLRDATIMRLLLTTGIRREEVVSLTLDQVNLESKEFFVRGKFGHRRRCFLKLTALTAVEIWLKQRPETTDPALFVSLDQASRRHPHGMKPDAVNDLLIRWRAEAGLAPNVKVNPHRWRHLFATEMSLAQNPFALQKLMGHRDITTTNGYMHLTPSSLQQLIEQYAPDVE